MRVKHLITMTGLLALMMAAPSFAQTDTSAIDVSGKGVVSVVPDAYRLTLVMEEKGATVAKLNGNMQSQMQSVLAFLLKNGIEEKHIQSMQVNLSPYYESTPEGRKQAGFMLSRSIKITDHNIDNYDKIIDGALARGVDGIQGFQFVASEQDEAYKKALINAVKDAKLRAELLASELNVKVGKVVNVSVGGSSYPMPMMHREMAVKADSFSTALPGEQQVEAHVNVRFTIE
ncbi:SIMPL domain-containing protein [Alteromonas sp. C1M14]|uniref:SIMPL domain-containing protein n=1 Tax=Alteromonas sp. C1M14 TaxID=2841567 RepID=UPI002090D3F6|nr:SIMPL domain-containing protein [Alteromonas sp. C1M14]